MTWTPEFPDSDDAIEAHDAALEATGQPYAACRNVGQVESALGRAANHWYYGEGGDDERMANAAAAIGHGVAQAQAFEDGNKRAAYWLMHGFLNNNGYGHVMNEDDPEVANVVLGWGEHTHGMEDMANLFKQRMGQQPRQANILDQIHDCLDASVFENPCDPEPQLRHEHLVWIPKTIFEILDKAGYDNPEQWCSIYLTGSLTTYQYAPHSDCDVSLFIDTKVFPEWSRAEMIGLMIDGFDSENLPGTTHEMQCFVVSKKLAPEDLYKPGLRSAYVVYGQGQGTWFVPPDKSRSHDVEREENEAYTIALENADKMDRLLRYEPDKALMFYKQIHKRRQRDQTRGKGDYSPSNIAYKFLENRGLIPRLDDYAKEHGKDLRFL
jgi:prophage maintenance system killer protein